jgi:hypothetical protein
MSLGLWKNFRNDRIMFGEFGALGRMILVAGQKKDGMLWAGNFCPKI